jgi:hypothetical protein
MIQKNIDICNLNWLELFLVHTPMSFKFYEHDLKRVVEVSWDIIKLPCAYLKQNQTSLRQLGAILTLESIWKMNLWYCACVFKYVDQSV